MIFVQVVQKRISLVSNCDENNLVMTNGIVSHPELQDFVMTSTKRHQFEICSGREQQYLETDLQSPTDSSEDSIEVKVYPISPRNKRKCTEPRRVQDTFATPLKKRMCFKIKDEISEEPFRPWRINGVKTVPFSNNNNNDIKAELKFLAVPKPQTLLNQPIPLIKKNFIKTEPTEPKIEVECDVPSPRVPVHPSLDHLGVCEADKILINSVEAFPALQQTYDPRKEQRNYKNMTRERRIEANARERTRVHTISAAFETLRRSVPSYSHNQKLSKLSVLRIACSYIMTLSTLLGDTNVTDTDSSSPSLAECVETVSKTIQKEGKLRKKKDDSE